MDQTSRSQSEGAGQQAVPYDNRFFDVIDRASLSSAQIIVPLVQALVPTRTVVDIGCGRGAWLRTFREYGSDVIAGYDGNYVDRSTLLIPQEAFTPMDLSGPLTLSGTFDLAVCLEVAEHLPQRRAEDLVKLLCRLAPAILFSAAIPGQGGTHHINEQWPHYWERYFNDLGFVKLDPIRGVVFANPGVATHYKQNTFLYVNRAQVERDERLAREWRLHQTQEVTIVALNRIVPLLSVSGLLAELGRTVARSVRNRLGA